MYRTVQEQREILLEAERRVRAGEPRAQVARDLGIPQSTLADWAHRGGWRRKDLVAVRDAERGKMILEVINEAAAGEREKKQADVAKMREALEASKAELAAAAPRDPDGAQLMDLMVEGPLPARKLAMGLADSLLRQGRVEEADRAVRLAVRFGEAEQAAGVREETKWREERERLTKWWAEKQTAYHKLHAATYFALEQLKALDELETRRSADECCPKCGRRMDFWPQEVERPDEEEPAGHSADSGDSADDFHRGESGDCASATDNGVGGGEKERKGEILGPQAESADEAARTRRRAAFGIGRHKG
jgi:hypothetical protein